MKKNNYHPQSRTQQFAVATLNDRFYPIGCIVRVSTKFGLYDHYAISVGYQWGEEYFAENQKGFGVRYVRKSELLQNGSILEFIPFSNDPALQQIILDRVASQIGKSYSMVFDNCEHFVQWVITGKRRSRQVENVVLGTLAVVSIGLLLRAILKK